MFSLTVKQKLINLLDSKSIELDNTKPETRSTLSYLDPILEVYNYKEIQMLENNISELLKIKLIYFNKDKNHNSLYQDEKFIYIYSNDNTYSLAYCFYLSLLINDKKAYINYVYNIKFINDIFEIMKNLSNNLRKKIFSKNIIILINNYIGTEEYEEQEKKELNEKLTICEKNIDNLDNLDNLDLIPIIDDIKNKDMEEIYSAIISCLLLSNNFENYEKIYNIIKDVELESIDLTKKMIEDLSILFNENEEQFREYEIFETNDLFNIKKINFYYILFKVILKNQLNINQIPFLFKNKKRILKFIKSKYDISSQINKIKESFTKEKIEFAINFFLDLYYYRQFTTAEKTKSSILKEKTKSIIFIEVNDEDNEENNPLFTNLGKDEWVQILNNSTFTLQIGNKSSCEYIKIVYGKNDIYINYNDFKKIIQNEKYKKQKYFSDFIKFSKFLEDIKLFFNKSFNNFPKFNLNINLKFETTFYSGTTNIFCNYLISFKENTKLIVISEYNILYKQDYNSFNYLIKIIAQILENQNRDNNEEEQLIYQVQEDNSKFYDVYNKYIDKINK